MRVSEKFNLGASQGGLDFVDVDIRNDVPVFIDPSAIRGQSGDWADTCKESLQTYFEALLDAIRSKDIQRIRTLITPLSEPNETHLGLSTGVSKGRGLGRAKLSDRLLDGLRNSRAAQTGLLADLEDTALFVENIGRDIVSDMTTCIIRAQLIEYTQAMCTFHEVSMEQQESGPTWDTGSKTWQDSRLTDLPRGHADKLILVPKAIVRLRLTVDKDEYYRGYLRPIFEDEELGKPLSSLVDVLKNGNRRVRLKELDEKLGTSKPAMVDNTLKHPEALDRYRHESRELPTPPLTSERFAEHTGTPATNFRELYEEVKAIAPGAAGATPYHRAIAKLFSALFETSLGNGKIEVKLHGGLKRMDIVYDNVAADGFFRWLSLNYKAATVVVECKNYSGPVANPEVDQLAMRFSAHRGKIGILAYRNIEDKDTLLRRCAAAAKDDHGYIMALDDDDLETLVTEAESYHAGKSTVPNTFELLRERFRSLTG